MATARKQPRKKSSVEVKWKSLLCHRARDVPLLAQAVASAGNWQTVIWGTGSNGPGFDFFIEYQVGHNADRTVWVLSTNVYVEPDEEQDEDFEIRAEVDPVSTDAAAVRVRKGTSAEVAVERLIKLWESNSDSQVADAIIEDNAFW